ncbi:hypothetical protein PV325_009364 [Microctonus aethiopoides]|nr:hypothetical protein PV325_009364 [Microctonus aethiopoides]
MWSHTMKVGKGIGHYVRRKRREKRANEKEKEGEKKARNHRREDRDDNMGRVLQRAATQSAWNVAGILQQCSEPCTTFRTLLQHSCNIPVPTLQCECCRNVAGTLQRQHCGLWLFPN